MIHGDLQVNAKYLRDFLLTFDVTQLSRDERHLLIEYHSHSDADTCYLRDYRLAELRVSY